MQDALENIDNSVDKRPGSLIYDALAPFASELAQLYVYANDILARGFVQTSFGEYLTELAFQLGVNRIRATAAVGIGCFNAEIPIGTRFSVENSDINFKVVSFIDKAPYGDGDTIEVNRYKLEAEEVGEKGNVLGVLIPIDYFSNLTVSYLSEISERAIDEETDEALRARTLDFIQRPHLDGNVSQYIYWADQFPGIGEVYVEKDKDNINTVNVYIADDSGAAADAELIQAFQEYLDPTVDGSGLGQAPIGAVVKVFTLTQLDLNIIVKVKTTEASKLPMIIEQTRVLIEKYIQGEANAERIVKWYEIAKIVDDNKLVISVDEVSINGVKNSNLEISAKQAIALTSYEVIV
ncbi:hypothetical protein FEZ08_10755 [Culicoidibacter larvae]|uniref:Baseplate J-like central domain-containing protein n=2 Tax=Culicoidibacter larvae TaxID=2579976 RepID=A0A5R8Q882_9FIRM|nr:hypothetical protein FEZ08_10755 [Culicoidibacter larvae]